MNYTDIVLTGKNILSWPHCECQVEAPHVHVRNVELMWTMLT